MTAVVLAIMLGLILFALLGIEDKLAELVRILKNK